VSWPLLARLLGGLAGVFAVLLLGLPLWRYLQGRLAFRSAVGFWVAGTGFACLATAAFSGEPDLVEPMVTLGVVLAAAGSVVQRFWGPDGA